MRFIRFSPIIFLGLSLVACKPTAAPERPRAAEPVNLDEDVSLLPDLLYLEHVTGGAGPNDRLPMIVLIHGLGDRPENIVALLDDLEVKARVILPQGPDRHGQGWSWFPVIPREGAKSVRAAALARSAKRIARLVGELRRTRPTVGSTIVSGFSQGGMITYVLATHYPEVVGYAIPMAGWMPEELWPTPEQAKRAAPMLAVHGEADPIVPFGPTRDMILALRERGAKIELVSEPGVRHQITPSIHAGLLAELEKEVLLRTGTSTTATATTSLPLRSEGLR